MKSNLIDFLNKKEIYHINIVDSYLKLMGYDFKKEERDEEYPIFNNQFYKIYRISYEKKYEILTLKFYINYELKLKKIYLFYMNTNLNNFFGKTVYDITQLYKTIIEFI